MKFIIVQDKTHGWNSWSLVTNSDALIASSSTVYQTLEDAQQAIKDFKTWVGQAGIEVISRGEPAKDWRQQAMEQLKLHRTKG